MDEDGIIPMPDTEDTRFAYVALFRAHIEGYQAHAKYYKLGLLLARKHATIEDGYARITEAGSQYWLEQTSKSWAVHFNNRSKRIRMEKRHHSKPE